MSRIQFPVFVFGILLVSVANAEEPCKFSHEETVSAIGVNAISADPPCADLIAGGISQPPGYANCKQFCVNIPQGTHLTRYDWSSDPHDVFEKGYEPKPSPENSTHICGEYKNWHSQTAKAVKLHICWE